MRFSMRSRMGIAAAGIVAQKQIELERTQLRIRRQGCRERSQFWRCFLTSYGLGRCYPCKDTEPICLSGKFNPLIERYSLVICGIVEANGETRVGS